MRSREEILRDLALYNKDLYLLQKELHQYEWDSEVELIILSSKNLIEMLKRMQVHEISSEILEDWANTIEAREDIGYQNDKIKEIINEIANPSLFGNVNERISDYIKALEK